MTDQPVTAEAIVDKTWLAIEIGGVAVVSDRPLSLLFGADGRLSGSGGVNRVAGGYTIDGGVLSLRPVTTMMAGPPEAMELESRFLRTLGAGGRLRLDGGRLVIAGDDDEAVARIVLAEETPPGARAAVTGSVLYRERIAMPAGAVVTVHLLDVSRQDVAADVLAEFHSADPGNVPIDFTLGYDPASIDERHEYAVAARIEVDGVLWWASTDRHPVLTRGNPDTVTVMVRRVAPPAE